MLQTFKLLVPVLIPSWRFFDVIAPSPRIEVGVINQRDDEDIQWREFRPRPDALSAFDFMKRVFWNPYWNESLFLMSCAERLMKGEEDFAREEIFQRIKRDIQDDGFVQFRLLFYVREGEEVKRYIVYISPIEPLGHEACV